MREVVYYNNLNEMARDTGKVHFGIDELYHTKISHILVKSEGRLKFKLLVTKEQAIDVIRGDYGSLLETRIKDYKGVYGYFNVTPNRLKEITENPEDKLVLHMEYEGAYISVNSGLYEGMVIITGNFPNLVFNDIQR